MRYLILLLVLVLAGCCEDNASSRAVKTEDPDLRLTYLFEQDGCKIYRFYDRWDYHYFNTCGQTMNARTVRSGKTTSHHEENI